jgi:hypothetical protein
MVASSFTGSTGCSNGFYIEDIAAPVGHASALVFDRCERHDVSSVSTCATGNRTLDPDDIAGVTALYPPVSITVPTAPTGFRIAPWQAELSE